MSERVQFEKPTGPLTVTVDFPDTLYTPTSLEEKCSAGMGGSGVGFRVRIVDRFSSEQPDVQWYIDGVPEFSPAPVAATPTEEEGEAAVHTAGLCALGPGDRSWDGARACARVEVFISRELTSLVPPRPAEGQGLVHLEWFVTAPPALQPPEGVGVDVCTARDRAVLADDAVQEAP